MKEILIISYFYPPCSLTAAQRPAGWVKHLHTFGYRPIVITRNWDSNFNTPEDQLKSSGDKVFVDNNENFEIHYLPYYSSLRDRLFNSSIRIFKQSSKILTLINSIGENFSNIFIPYSNIYDYSKELIKKRQIELFIITANPYNLFRFGFLLNKKFNIPWIADYRDDWTTSEINTSISYNKFLLFFNKKSEKKWVGTSSLITSISDYYTKKIASFVGVNGAVLLNGFDSDNYFFEENINNRDSDLKIVYNGSLYNTQPIEQFLEVVKEINIDLPQKIRLYFPGLDFDKKQSKRVRLLVEEIKEFVYISERISKRQVLKLQSEADLLLMISHKGYKGIPSSKLYEYIGFKKPILLFPSDSDIVEDTLNRTSLGMIYNDRETLKIELLKMLELKNKKVPLLINYNLLEIEKYSILSQTKKLSDLISQII